ncbi:MAG: DUF2341 domain-containing protein [Methanosarcinales archaeon]|nr:DUF2341 domain-containing protein [Methanosarcinales archaeon]
MKLAMELLLFLVVALCLVGSASALQVVPDLYGYGTDTRAAYGAANDPEICIVDSLGTSSGNPDWNSTGYTVGVFKGTLLECVEGLDTLNGETIDGHVVSANSGKIILFETSGTINQTGSDGVTEPYTYSVGNYTTIAGQTSPNPGILLRNILIYAPATHDIFIQHIRGRMDGPPSLPFGNHKSFSFVNTYNIVVDHVSAAWGADVQMAFWYSGSGVLENFTVSNCLIAEPRTNVGLVDEDADDAKGFMIGESGNHIYPRNGLLYGNVFMNTRYRAPELKYCEALAVNNYCYNNLVYSMRTWDAQGAGNYSLVGNVIAGGPMSGASASDWVTSTGTVNWSSPLSQHSLYTYDNKCDSGTQTSSSDWSYVRVRALNEILTADGPNYPNVKVTGEDPVNDSPLWSTGLTYLPSEDVKDYIIENVGAYPAFRDSLDTRFIANITDDTGRASLASGPPAAGDWPVLDVNTTILSIPANPHINSGNGYTNLEVWLQGLANDVEGDAEEEEISYDNVIKLSYTDTVFNDLIYNGVGGIGAVDTSRRSWIWFNLSEYNSTDTISVANLSLYWYHNHTNRNKSTNVGIYLSNATTDTEYLTWNNSSNGVAWREPGGNWLDANWVDNGTTPFDSELFPNTAADESFHTFDITELVQSIVNESRTNNGFFIIANETNTNYIAFSSFDNATEAHRPTLNITHSIAGAETPETSDFTYYKIITINQTTINQSIGTGTYPLLVSTTDTDLRDHCQADGDDIVFFNADNTSLLPYEQELWNSTTGELVSWVGLEDVTNISYIVMYYNNSTIANSENATGVWDSNYMMVQHFQETDIDGGAGDIKDSTSNDNDGNTHNMTSANLDTGLVDGCFNFSKSNEARVNVSDDATLDGFTTGFTISGLFNFNQEGAYYLVNKYDAGGDQRAWLLKLEGNDNLRIYVDDAGTAAEISNFNPTIVPGTDYKIDAVWESGEYPLLYFDGALANEVDHDGLVSSIKDSSSILRIGGGYSPGNTLFTGDEIRVSNIARSHAYIETDYNNTAYPDLFISIGAEQGGGAPDTKFEYWDGAAWQENPVDYHLWFECFWNTSGYPDGVCSNAEQSGSQHSLRITNNGTAAGIPKMKFNESSPAEVTVYVDDDYTVAGAVVITNSYQAVGASLGPGENINLSAWAKLEDLTSIWEYIIYVEVQ